MPIVGQQKDGGDVKAGGVGMVGAAAGAGGGGGGGGASPTFKIDERFPLAGTKAVHVGLSWDLLRKGSVDLDASAVLFDGAGNFLTSVYFGNLSTASCAALGNKVFVAHSGDNRDGAGEGDDEYITCYLDQMPAVCRAIVFSVTSYNGDPFWGVQSAKLRIADNTSKQELGNFSLAAGGSQTALLMAKLYRDDTNMWYLHVIGQATEGRSFGDLLPLMQMQLRDIIPNVQIQARPMVVVLTKGEAMQLGGGAGGLKNLMCGLGWDKMGDQPIDLDASVVIFDRQQNMIDSVFFNRLENDNKSIRHAGDNQTGEGEGDDEKVFMNLDAVPDNADTLYLVVNSYKGDPFSMIKNAYVRVVDLDSKAELCRFQLAAAGSQEHTALIMCKIYRYREHVGDGAEPAPGAAAPPASKRWMMKAVGHSTVGRMYKDNVKDCQTELIGKLRVNKSAAGFQYTPQRQGAAAMPAPAPAAAGRGAAPAAYAVAPAAYAVAPAAGGAAAAAGGAAAPPQQPSGCCVIL